MTFSYTQSYCVMMRIRWGIATRNGTNRCASFFWSAAWASVQELQRATFLERRMGVSQNPPSLSNRIPGGTAVLRAIELGKKPPGIKEWPS